MDKLRAGLLTGREARLLLLLAGASFLRNQLWLTPSPLMTVIMDDMRIGYRQGGQLLFIVTVLMGISLFVGSRVIDRLGASRAMAIAIGCLALDGLFAFFCRSYPLVLVGRAFSGIGYGLGSGAQGVLVTERFPPARRGLINTINAAVNALSIAAAYAVTVPLYRFFHSWRGTLLFWSLVSAAWMGIFILFDAAHAPAAAGAPSRAPASRAQAARLPKVWCMAAAMGGLTILYTGYSSYLPSFLAEARGFSLQAAGTATGMISVAGLAGCLLCGPLFTRLRAVHIPLLALELLVLAGAAGTALFPSHTGIYGGILLLGFCFNGWGTVSVTALMNMDGMTPRLMGGAVAIYSGLGGIAAVCVPGMFSFFQARFGIRSALALFCLFVLPALAGTGLYALLCRRRGA